jgi:hypothetical protein
MLIVVVKTASALGLDTLHIFCPSGCREPVQCRPDLSELVLSAERLFPEELTAGQPHFSNFGPERHPLGIQRK